MICRPTKPIFMITIEVVCYNITSVLNAVKGGANRIELCDSPGDGGTTPSAGMIATAKKLTTLPIFVMIRPRGGDFLYSDQEFEVMKADILAAKSLGADGVVLGILTSDGKIDLNRNRELVQLARPMKVTCHRAFDMTDDPFAALEACVAIGFDRILTSGQQSGVEKGMALLAQLVAKAGRRIVIMPGAGVSEYNVKQLVKTSGAKEIHTSGKSFEYSPMAFRNPAVAMGTDPREYQRLIVDPERVIRIRQLAEGK